MLLLSQHRGQRLQVRCKADALPRQAVATHCCLLTWPCVQAARPSSRVQSEGDVRPGVAVGAEVKSEQRLMSLTGRLPWRSSAPRPAAGLDADGRNCPAERLQKQSTAVPVEQCPKNYQAATGWNRLSDKMPAMMKSTNTAPCAITKGGSDPLGAAIVAARQRSIWSHQYKTRV